MDNELTIEEKYSGHWLKITVALAVLTLTMFIVYSNIEDLLWKGYLRLIAFCGLAATVLSSLKVREGKHKIHLTIREGHLFVTYERNNRSVAEDLFKLANIKSLRVGPRPTEILGGEFLFKDLVINLDLNDSDRPLALAEVNGRPLALTPEGAGEALEFIASHAPDIDIPGNYRENPEAG